MKKCLYISHLADFPTGWSIAAAQNILALNQVGIDVVPRSILLSRDNSEKLPDNIKELQSKSAAGCSVVIQHCLAHHLKYDSRLGKNIAYCAYESYGSWYNNWNSKINMMDELWVPSAFTKEVFEKSGVTIPIKVVPHTFDLHKYKVIYEKIKHPQLDGNYVFYTIADLNIRKNLRAIVQAFHLEFTPNEPVRLVIKSGRFGKTPEETRDIIFKECDKIKEGMKLHRYINSYIREVVITDELSENEIMGLHQSFDCYVNTSHGEAFAIPQWEAMAFGNQIVTAEGVYDYLEPVKHLTYQFPTHTNTCFGTMDTFWEVGSSREFWKDCNIQDVAAAMRKAYNDRNDFTEKSKILKQNAENYSYEKIGNLMKGLIDG